VVRLLPPLNIKEKEEQNLIDGLSSLIRTYMTASKADAAVTH
jgi:acetylornithine/succinyldiaminopimelate/putrescine aminotransferase